ncbi:plasminogen activator, urokinase a [Trichomycterus rosablanca]|uniref:plasminogen activator, urokinase a n=1 Tax=Trichomycterus rosablanca TaxID=2290929 RepID=UPI002F35C08C
MWWLIMFLVTFSFQVAESYPDKYWPWWKYDIPPRREIQQNYDECVAEGSNGKEYRGTMATAFNGDRCLHWNKVQYLMAEDVAQGLGSHNHCRNLDDRAMPWCWVRSNRRKIRKFCNIPQCEAKPTKRPATPDTPKQDTEKTCGESSYEVRRNKIVGGLRTSIESFPWIASIFKNEMFSCGGTLIAPGWVLTAAHCFSGGKRIKLEQYTVYMGKNAINETDPSKEQKFKVAKLVIHEDYDNIAENFNHDIALLKIVDSKGQGAQKTATVRTACLPPARQMRPYGAYCTIAGYGREKSNSIFYSRFLKEAKVELISQSVCQQKEYYGQNVTNNMFCAGSPTWTEDACQGDSGGPLLCEVNGRMFLYGIISWGEECASQFKPGVYTKVTNYNNWIAKHTGLPFFTKGIMYPRKD